MVNIIGNVFIDFAPIPIQSIGLDVVGMMLCVLPSHAIFLKVSFWQPVRAGMVDKYLFWPPHSPASLTVFTK